MSYLELAKKWRHNRLMVRILLSNSVGKHKKGSLPKTEKIDI